MCLPKQMSDGLRAELRPVPSMRNSDGRASIGTVVAASYERAQVRKTQRRCSMHVREIMTSNPFCCTADTSLEDVAKAMVEHDCGEIPIVRNSMDKTLIGVVTDRDIVCRLVARGTNPVDETAESCMSSPVVAVRETTPVEECARIMEESKIRRVPVVNGGGMCCGIVSQADIAKHASRKITADLVKDVSQPARV
jgi:CBS domain-containing protein